jgi:hypothetical protein
MERVFLRKSIVSTITIAACEQVTKYDGSWLCLAFNNWRNMSGYVNSHALVRLGLSHLVPNAECCIIVGIYTGLENHIVADIM